MAFAKAAREEEYMKAKKQKQNLTRRDFLTTATAGAGATALVGIGSEEAGAFQQSDVRKWDCEEGIVIPGTGGAGLT